MAENLLSTVVIGKNEGERLTKCLESIKKISENNETIYVDSDSTDDSVERAKNFGVKVIQIKPERPTAAIGRNVGWKAATGKYILFLDGDTQIQPDFVTEALPLFEQPEIAAVCGHIQELHPEKSVYNQVIEIDWNSIAGEITFFGGNVLIRRELLEKTQGFNSHLIAGEEPELSQRIRSLGYRIICHDQVMIKHDLNMTTLSQYCKRSFRTGYAYALVSQMDKYTDDRFWQKESRHNFIKGGLLLLTPFLKILILLWIFLIAKSAYKVKAKNWKTKVLYGIHSQLQHIPILFGQLTYWWDHFTNNKRKLIEYK